MGDYLKKIGILTAVIVGTTLFTIYIDLGYTADRIFGTCIILGSMAYIFADELSETGFFVGSGYVSKSSPEIVIKILGVLFWIVGVVVLVAALLSA
jgi:hypothetical protein